MRSLEDCAHEMALVETAKRGDTAAYGELVRMHQREARRVAAAIGGIDIADDCAQEAFIRGFRSLHRFNADAPFRPWLLTIVVRVTRNQQRSAARWKRNTQRTSDGRHSEGTGVSAEHEALTNDLHASVRTALSALPSKYREVLTCRYLLELTERETAQVLGLPAGTVKSRLARALGHMEALVQKETSDG